MKTINETVQEAAVLLRLFQTKLGSSRTMCDDPGKVLWDRVNTACQNLSHFNSDFQEMKREASD